MASFEDNLKQLIRQHGGEIDLSIVKYSHRKEFGEDIPTQGSSSLKDLIQSFDSIFITQHSDNLSRWFATILSSNDSVEGNLNALLQKHGSLDISNVKYYYKDMYGETLHYKGSLKAWLQSFPSLSTEPGKNDQWMVKLSPSKTGTPLNSQGLVQDLTIDSTLISTPHDRERREERGIVKIDLQRARRYGMVEDGKRRGTKKYTYGGHVFVYDEKNNKAITSWKLKEGNVRSKSGTRKVNPILVQKSEEHNNSKATKMHNKLKNALVTKTKEWRSHSVFIVDMSGKKSTLELCLNVSTIPILSHFVYCLCVYL